MPQLDALTYLTQYVYLLITFIAVYFFVLSVIIPKTLCALKVRQKLNSLNIDPIESQKPSESTNLVAKSALDSEAAITFLQYSNLLSQNWAAETAKVSTVEVAGRWLMSARTLQLAQMMRLKKLLCGHIVQKIGG